MMATTEDSFRFLRAAWFQAYLSREAHPREWESESGEALREERNLKLRAMFDEQTDAILAGDESITIAPRCGADMDRRAN